jgi:hypothetical protein
MEHWMEAYYRELAESGVPDRQVYRQGSKQWEYNDWLTEQAGSDVASASEWRATLWEHTRMLKRSYALDKYRGRWRDEDAIVRAHAELSKAPVVSESG